MPYSLMRHLFYAAASLLAAADGHAQSVTPPATTTEAPIGSVTTSALASFPKGQLSDVVQPQGYRLDLTVDPSQERFTGHVEIDAALRTASTTVFLHGYNLSVHRAAVTAGGKSFVGTWHQLDQTGVAMLTFAEAIPAGPITFTFDYDAAFENAPEGLFRVHVGSDWYAWTQFESIDARAAFPCFDQPSFKTPFTIVLRTPPGLAAVSNAPEASTTREAGLDVHRFAKTLPLPTYLVAMMAGPFAITEGTVPPTPQRAAPLPLRVISTKPNAAKLNFALENSKRIVSLLEGYFGDAFPYPKLDQITAPTMPGAMENAGADLYDDSLIVLDDGAPIARKREFGMVVAHELSHQWFGDLVTPTWWDDIWLNESFANWMGYRIGDAWRPDLNIRAGALAEGFAAMDTDALVAGRPIRQAISSNDQIDGSFDSITYGKGGQVVAMIAAFMGDDTFRQGVRRYLAAHRYGNATSTDFFAAMAEAAQDARIVPAMQSFTDQQGVPLLTFRRNGDQPSAGWTVTQSRYAPLGTTPPPTRWGIPMCFHRGETRQCSLLTEVTTVVNPTGDGPLMPNAGGTGYYRFALPDADWDALIAGADKLDSGEAQAAADSLAANLVAGRGGVTKLALLAEKLVRHSDSYAADAATNALADFAGIGFLDDAGRKGWQRFISRLYGPLLTEYGFDPRAGAYATEAPERSQRRAQIVSRLLGTGREKALTDQIDKATIAFLAGDKQALDPTWLPLGLGIHIALGKLPAAKALLDQALASEDPVFRPAAMGAVSGSGSRDIANWLLNGVTDRRLRASEQHDLLRGVLLTTSTREVGYNWMVAHLDELTADSGGIFFAARLPALLSRFCSVTRADEFARELRPRFNGKPGAMELERVIERVRNCGTLQDQRAVQISANFARLK